MVLDEDDPAPEGYREVLERLGADGIRAWFSCLVIPVQLQGHLPSGDAFFLYCRRRSCWLGTAPRDGDPVGAPAWRHEVTRWEDDDAGYLEPEEAEAVFRELLAEYEAQRS